MKLIHYTLELNYSFCINHNCLCGHIYLPKGSKIVSVYHLELEQKKSKIHIAVDESKSEELICCNFIIFSDKHTIKLEDKWEHLVTIPTSHNSSIYYDVFCTVRLNSSV